MKQYLLITAALFMASFTYSQTDSQEVELIQQLFGMEKQAIITDFVTPSESQKDAFWKNYHDYEIQRKELGKQRIELLKEYADQYLKMTAEQADKWNKKAIDLQKKTDALIVNYHGKIKKEADGIVATQFYQIEYYILTVIRMEILDEIPFVKKPVLEDNESDE
jgi:vacuolar-type H+-ATPase subunit H